MGIFRRSKKKRYKSYQDEVNEIRSLLDQRRNSGKDKGQYVQMSGIRAFETKRNPIMKFFDKITDGLRNVASNAVPVKESYDFDEYGNSKAQGRGYVISLLYNWAEGNYQNRLVVQKSLQNYAEYKKMYNAFGMVKSAIDSLLMVARDMKWRIVSENPKHDQLSQAVEKWMKRHNFDMYFHTILHRALLNGEIWFEIIRDNATGKIVRFKEMPVETMFVVLNQRGRFIRYEQRLDGGGYGLSGLVTAVRKPIPFSKQQMLHLKFMSQHGEAYGTSAIHSALPDLYAYEEVMERLMELMNICTYPLVHFAAESKASQDQLVKALPKQQRTGDIITGKDVEVKMIGFQGQVIDLVPYIKFLREAAVMSMGVPMAFLGLGEGTNKATLQIQQSIVQNKTETYLAELTFQLKANLFPMILDDLNLNYNNEEIPSVEFHNVSVYDEREQQGFLAGQYKSGVISWKEMRRKLGLPAEVDFDEKIEKHPALRVAPPDPEGGGMPQPVAPPAKGTTKPVGPPPINIPALPPTAGPLAFPIESVNLDLQMGWLPGIAPAMGGDDAQKSEKETEIETVDQYVPGFSEKSEELRKAMAKAVIDMRIIQRSLDNGNFEDVSLLFEEASKNYRATLTAYKKWLDDGNSRRMLSAPLDVQFVIMDLHDQVKRVSLRILHMEKQYNAALKATGKEEKED